MKLHVDNMTCNACARRVTTAIQTLDPAAEVRVDLEAKLVEVQSSAPSPALAAALDAAGYPAVEAA